MNKYLTKIKKMTNRVDFQVIVLTVVLTSVAVLISGGIYWDYAFDVLMSSHENRAEAIYDSVEKLVDKDSFRYINSPEDMESELYKDSLETMLMLKNASGVLYLYTAKENEQGEFVYVIDGLEEYYDFRYPNDLIEYEIVPDMKLAMTDVKVMPEAINHTEWGEIFVAYMPVHDNNGDVLGVVGIEFDATESYNSYTRIQTVTYVILVVCALLSAVFAALIFRRISNPLYLDKNTKDVHTGLKNRNGYEVDFNNLMAKEKYDNIGILVIDINGLKEINDRLGHIAGDSYIKLVSQIVIDSKSKNMVAYRTGGDEFVIVARDARKSEFDEFVNVSAEKVKNQKKLTNMRCSFACGFAIYNRDLDGDLKDTFHRADNAMYKDKRRQKELNER